MADHRLIFIVFALCVLVVVGKLFEGRRGFHHRIERKRLMTASEVRFWHVLAAALPEYRILDQVAMGALLKPVEGLSRREWWSTFGRFSQKIVDFVIVDASSGEVLAVVELDDRTHDRAKDDARDALLASGGYPVFRFTGGRQIAADVRPRFARLLDLDRSPIAWRPRAVS